MSLVETWRANLAANDLILNALGPEELASRYSPRTRTVASQFAHLHNVRIYHLEKRAKDLSNGLVKFESKISPNRAQLKKAFKASLTRAAFRNPLATRPSGTVSMFWSAFRIHASVRLFT